MARGGLPAKFQEKLQNAIASMHRGRYGYENLPWDLIDMLLIAGCSGVEVAAILGIHKHTLYAVCEEVKNRPFRQYKAEKRSAGNAMIRLSKFQKTIEGDTKLLQWESKQRLGETDKPNQGKADAEGKGDFAVFEIADNERSVKDYNPLNHDAAEPDPEDVGDLSDD